MTNINILREYPDPQARRFADPFLLDKHRVLHSTSFRRLGYKTQVFLPLEADHFRTRLTHTLEVAHVAEMLAEKFGGNSRLVEVISLAHDLGHGPFGHSSETILEKLLASVGGFEHNEQSIRTVKFLEGPYPWFRGLNLTRSVILGLEAHNTPYDRADQADLNDHLEGQLVNWADRIAYNSADLEDALGANFLTAGDLQQLALCRRAFEMVPEEFQDRPIYAIRRIVLENLQQILIDALKIDDIAGKKLVRLRAEELKDLEAVESFLMENVYLSPLLARTSQTVQEMIAKIFHCYKNKPELLPKRYLNRQPEVPLDRTIGDYIAGMTDRFCLKVYRQMFGEGDTLLQSIQPVVGAGS
jgi:dGTPase